MFRAESATLRSPQPCGVRKISCGVRNPAESATLRSPQPCGVRNWWGDWWGDW